MSFLFNIKISMKIVIDVLQQNSDSERCLQKAIFQSYVI